MILPVIFAVAAALANALGSVLQRKGARGQPEDESMSVRLLWDMAHQPAWVGGIVCMLTGLGFQVAALSTGPISLVQPILVGELGFTLLLSAVLFGAALHAREWMAVVGMNGGIALLLVALHPSGGDTRAVTGPTWVVGCAITLAVIAVLVLVAHRFHHAHRAAYLGIASGLSFGFLAVLVSGVTGMFAGGFDAVFSSWQIYAVFGAGPVGFFLLQMTLRAGSLVASQPGLTLSNPVVGIGWGVAVFGEEVRGGGWIVAEVIGFAVIAACTLLLARSPSLHGEAGAYEERDGAEAASAGTATASGDTASAAGGAATAERSRSSH